LAHFLQFRGQKINDDRRLPSLDQTLAKSDEPRERLFAESV